MEKKQSIFKKNFTLMVIGQIISIFGNAILRFALPLYLLEETGSPALFGIVSACSLIPMVLLMPIGGIIADRVNKKKVMVILDFSVAIIIVGFMALMGKANLIFIIIATLMLLYGIQGTYGPSVQASIPLLVEKENLLQGNAIINQVNALSNLLGPVLGGFLYGFYGLKPILLVSILCFTVSAIMEIFMKIPYIKRKSEVGILKVCRGDFKESISFIANEKKIVLKVIIIVSAINLFLTSLIVIGVPVLVTNTLNMSSEAYGFVQGTLGLGGLVGGILTGVLGKKLKVQESYMCLIIAAILLLPIGFALMGGVSPKVIYMIILISCFLIMVVSTIFSIQMLTFIQGETPGELIGKVISLCMAASLCMQPIGQILYGGLFEKFQNQTFIIMFLGGIVSFIIAIKSKQVFGKLMVEKELA